MDWKGKEELMTGEVAGQLWQIKEFLFLPHLSCGETVPAVPENQREYVF